MSFQKEHSSVKYRVEVKPPGWDGYKYALFYSKEYGDIHGGATEFKTKQELLAFLKRTFKGWESYDSIVGRKGDKVTAQNLQFKSFTEDITKMELFGECQLQSFWERK